MLKRSLYYKMIFFKLLLSFLMLVFSLCTISFADEVESKKTLKIGLLPYISTTRLINIFSPLKVYLEKNYDYDVTLFTAPSYKKFISRTEEQLYDIVFTAPHFALLAENSGHYLRLAKFSRELAACIVVCQDSQIDSLKDLNGRVVSTPDSLALVSFLGENLLRNSGLVLTNSTFILRTPSHNNSIISVGNKESDAGIVASGVFEYFSSIQTSKKKYRLLKCSDPVSSTMFLINRNLAVEYREELTSALLLFPQSIAGSSFFKSTQFRGMEPITDKDMQVMEKYLATLKRRL